MLKDFKTTNTDGCFIIQKTFFGFGAHIDFVSPILMREKIFILSIDLICIRFWWNVYKKDKIVKYDKKYSPIKKR